MPGVWFFKLFKDGRSARMGLVMGQKMQTQSRLLVSLFLAGALLLPCVAVFHAMTGDMGMAMAGGGGGQHQCCISQQGPGLKSAHTIGIISDAYRNIFLSLILTAAFFMSRRRMLDVHLRPLAFTKIRGLERSRTQHTLSKFERALQRGTLQPLVYEPALFP